MARPRTKLLTPMTLAALKAHDADIPWSARIKYEKTGIEVLAKINTLASWDSDGKVEKEDVEDVYENLEAEHDGDDSADMEASDMDEDEGEQQEQPVSPEESDPLKFDLADFITEVAKERRDYILEGIELGGSSKSIAFHKPDLPDVRIDKAHAALPVLVKTAALRHPTMLVGPAGSGKTTAGRQLAEVFGVEFYANSNSPMDTRTLAFGYMDGGGVYRPGYLYEPMKNGGVLLDDEVDASNPAVMVSKNSAIENRMAWFPNGEKVNAHEDFIYVASANTFGRGSDRMYVGRTQLDAATLNRFIFLEWNYDEELENEISCDPDWTKWVQRVRKVVFDHKMRYVVSPRQSITGGKLIASGIPIRDVRNMTVFAGWAEEDVKKVMSSL